VTQKHIFGEMDDNSKSFHILSWAPFIYTSSKCMAFMYSEMFYSIDISFSLVFQMKNCEAAVSLTLNDFCHFHVHE